MKHFLLYLAVSLLLLTRCSSDDDHQAAKKKPRLLSIAMSLPQSDGTLLPGYTRKFFYSNAGRLEREEYATYKSSEDRFDVSWTNAFTYAGNMVTQIDRTYTKPERTVTTGYTYDSKGRVSTIRVDDDTETRVTVTYEAGDTINALYEQGDGHWFKYRMAMSGDNLVYRKTIDDSQHVTSETYYEYDEKVNPYNLLGFMDTFFEKNVSHNNELGQNTTYYTSDVPDFIPYGHAYSYINGLPVKQTIWYKSPVTGERVGVVQWEFEYEE